MQALSSISIVSLLNREQTRLGAGPESIGTSDDMKTLENAGFSARLNTYHRMSNAHRALSAFSGKAPIYHISSIRRVAVRYGLVLDQTNAYNGSIPTDLPGVIRDFSGRFGIDQKYMGNNMYVLAPKESFTRERSVPDPVLLYRVTRNSFVFVHKWGDDFTPWAYVRNLFRRRTLIPICAVAYSVLAFFGVRFLMSGVDPQNEGALVVFGLIFGLIVAVIYPVCFSGRNAEDFGSAW